MSNIKSELGKTAASYESRARRAETNGDRAMLQSYARFYENLAKTEAPEPKGDVLFGLGPANDAGSQLSSRLAEG